MSDIPSWGHMFFVTVHAVAATAALIAGIFALHTSRGFRVHQTGVIVMSAALGGSLALGWAGFSTATRVTYSLLAALASVMIVQLFRAGRARSRDRGDTWSFSSNGSRGRMGPAFVRALGFNVISLTVAGTIVPVLRVGAGALGVVIAVAVSVTVAHLLVERRARLVRSEPVWLEQA